MNSRHITNTEIAQRQFQVRREAHRARTAFTISGVRQLIGNTFIALGTQLYGARESNRRTLPEPTTSVAIGD